MVMRFPVITNWPKLQETFAYKRFEEGIYFCESTDFLSEVFFFPPFFSRTCLDSIGKKYIFENLAFSIHIRTI